MTRLQSATAALLEAQKDLAEKRVASAVAVDALIAANRPTPVALESAQRDAESAYNLALRGFMAAGDEFAAATEAAEKPCHIRLGPGTPIICGGTEPEGTPIRPLSEVDPSTLCAACWLKFVDAADAKNLEQLKKWSDSVVMLWEMFFADTEEFGDVTGLLIALEALISWPPEAKEVGDSLSDSIAALKDKLAKRTFLPAMMVHIRAAGAATKWDEINGHWEAASAAFNEATKP